jgi:hypothetical protein
MIHLPPQRLNGINSKTKNTGPDSILSSLDTINDIYSSIKSDLLQTCTISNIYLDFQADYVQFRSRLEILKGITYNEFKFEITELSDAIRMGLIDRQYLPDLLTLKRIAPYDHNIIKINMLLLDKHGDFIDGRDI